MADLSITSAEVLKSSAGRRIDGIAGETLVAGDVVYKDAADSNKIKLADANHSTTSKSTVVGIVENGAAAGQPCDYVSQDDTFVIGTTAAPAVGQVYVLSNTAGKLMPLSDVSTAATARISVVGIGKTAGGLHLSIINSGVTKTS